MEKKRVEVGQRLKFYVVHGRCVSRAALNRKDSRAELFRDAHEQRDNSNAIEVVKR